MYVGNGKITEDLSSALDYIRLAAQTDNVKKIDFNGSKSMSYYISKEGDVFGVQQYKKFFLTKEIVRRKYKKGYYVRLSLGCHKVYDAYLSSLLYHTFLDKDADEEDIVPKDGDIYNYSLSNLKVLRKTEKDSKVQRMYDFQDIYRKKFNDCVDFISLRTGLIRSDCQDLVSETFLDLCQRKKPFEDSFLFANTWYRRSLQRAIDFFKKHIKSNNSLFYDDGEEIYGNSDCNVEIEDLYKYVMSERTRIFLQKRFSGYSNVEIASQYKIPVGTVSADVSKIMKHLREKYKKDIEIFRDGL